MPMVTRSPIRRPAPTGAALPTWLTFNASTRTFSGTPVSANVGTFGVKASATDPGGLSASETFNIAVSDDIDYDSEPVQRVQHPGAIPV